VGASGCLDVGQALKCVFAGVSTPRGDAGGKLEALALEGEAEVAAQIGAEGAQIDGK
jgi:hypothetical protein